MGLFFKASDMRPTIMRNIRNMFLRGRPTDQEVRTLHGIVSALTGKKYKNLKI
jgi:tRNA/rRNA methyltransferase